MDLIWLLQQPEFDVDVLVASVPALPTLLGRGEYGAAAEAIVRKHLRQEGNLKAVVADFSTLARSTRREIEALQRRGAKSERKMKRQERRAAEKASRHARGAEEKMTRASEWTPAMEHAAAEKAMRRAHAAAEKAMRQENSARLWAARVGEDWKAVRKDGAARLTALQSQHAAKLEAWRSDPSVRFESESVPGTEGSASRRDEPARPAGSIDD